MRPVVDRLQAVGVAVVVVTIWAVLGAVVGTVTGLYHGANGGQRYGDEVAATAEVGACRRTGPIAGDALGYWWDCDVTIRTAEGRVVRMTVDRSMVTPDDAGRPVPFQETCDRQAGAGPAGSPSRLDHPPAAPSRPPWSRDVTNG